MEWNETNFDVNARQYTREAYQAQKWAFVSDVARLQALVSHGGIYLDTDFELIDNLDKFCISILLPDLKIQNGSRQG